MLRSPKLIVAAPGSYKGTIISRRACDIIVDATQAVFSGATIEKLTLADGGEGTLEMFDSHFGCVTHTHKVLGPLGMQVDARIGFMAGRTAIVETAQAIGLSLLDPTERDPLAASTYGVGEMIKEAIRRDATEIVVTLGDSATMDMGVGMLSALGVKFYCANGELHSPTLRSLAEIVDFDDRSLRALRERVTFVGLADTDDYLCGEVGQVRLFGKQKGLPSGMIPAVERAYLHFADVIKGRLGVDVIQLVRASGSGGLGAALHAFLGAPLHNTLDYMATKVDLCEPLAKADLVITGEGRLDEQTKLGKVPYFVAARVKKLCIAIVGSYTLRGWDEMEKASKHCSIFCLNPELAMINPEQALRDGVTSILTMVL